MLLRTRPSFLALGAVVSLLLLLTLLAACLASRDQLRILRLRHNPCNFAIGINHHGFCLQLRRMHTPFPSLRPAAGSTLSTTAVAGGSLEVMCIRPRPTWLLPHLWFAAGRDTFVDYADLMLPNWLTLPACLILPALRHRRRRPHQAPAFPVLVELRTNAVVQ